MWFRKPDETEDAIEEQIAAVTRELALNEPTSENYQKLILILDQLNKIKAGRRPGRVSRDTMWIVLGSLIGMGVHMLYENKHIISRSFPSPIQPRLPK